MPMRFLLIVLLLGPLMLLFVPHAGADTLGLVWENDLFAGTDNHYTNGLSLFWARENLSAFQSTPAALPMDWAAGLLGFDAGRYDFRAVSHQLFQTMQTPRNIDRVPPDPQDLPYAGLLAWEGSIYAANRHVADRFSLIAGLVGPDAGAKPAQDLAHHIFKGNHPRGWSYQLHDEPVVNLRLSRHWRAWHVGGGAAPGADLVPGVALNAGLLQSGLVTGAVLRWGRHLATSFPGAALVASRNTYIETDPGIGYWYLYVGLAGRLVANDLLVQGNVFRDSRGTALRHTGITRTLGAVWDDGGMMVAFTFVDRSPRARSVSRDDQFGSLSFSWFY